MVVHSNGLAYVNFYRGTGGDRDEIWMVRPDGTVACVADELSHPNGMVITPDGGALLACETYAHRVIAFTVASDGTLSDKRDFATEIPWPTDYALILPGQCGSAAFLRESSYAQGAAEASPIEWLLRMGIGLRLPCSADQIGEHSSC